MTTSRFGLLLVLLTLAFSVHAADLDKGAQASTSQKAGEVQKQLPPILDDENIPAFLRTDPCDTGDS